MSKFKEMSEFERKHMRLLIKSTIDILELSAKHAKTDLSNLINEWKDILEELDNAFSEVSDG